MALAGLKYKNNFQGDSIFVLLLIKSWSVFWIIASPQSLYFSIQYSLDLEWTKGINLCFEIPQRFCVTESLTIEYKLLLYILTNTVTPKPFGSLSKRVSALPAYEKLLYAKGISRWGTEFPLSPGGTKLSREQKMHPGFHTVFVLLEKISETCGISYLSGSRQIALFFIEHQTFLLLKSQDFGNMWWKRN